MTFRGFPFDSRDRGLWKWTGKRFGEVAKCDLALSILMASTHHMELT